MNENVSLVFFIWKQMINDGVCLTWSSEGVNTQVSPDSQDECRL